MNDLHELLMNLTPSDLTHRWKETEGEILKAAFLTLAERQLILPDAHMAVRDTEGNIKSERYFFKLKEEEL